MNLSDFQAECAEWWRLASVRLAALVAVLTGVVTDNPELVIGLLGIIPADPMVRLVFSLGIAGLVFLVPTIARLWPQKLGGQSDGATDSEA